MPSDQSSFVQPQVVQDRLDTLPDSAPVPDLSKYTMGDLRELLKGQSDPASFITKNRIRPGSFPDSSIPGGKLSVPTISTQAELSALSRTRTSGDFCKYVDDTLGIMWIFQYRPESSQAQWEFVFGQPAYVITVSNDAIPLSAAWQYTLNAGPSYVVPFNGWYMCNAVTQPNSNNPNGVLYESTIAVNGTATGNGGGIKTMTQALDNATVPLIDQANVATGVGATLCVMYRNNNGAGTTMNVTNRRMLIVPRFITG